MGALDLRRHCDRCFDERRRRRWPVPVAMPHHHQHAGRDRLLQLDQPHLGIVFVDREQWREREAQSRRDHRLHRPVVVGAKHDAWPNATSVQKVLGQVLVLTVLVADHREAVQVGGRKRALSQG